MKHLLSRHSLTAIAAGVVAAVVAAGGGAYALASSSGGTITVCVSHKTGPHYKAKQCAVSRETP